MVSKFTIPLIIIIFGLIAFYVSGQNPHQFIETKLYDSNQNLIKNNLAIVEGQEGVAFVSFDVNIDNKDSVDLTFYLTSIVPNQLSSILPSNEITIKSGEIGTLSTGLIDVEQFVGNMQEFCITAKSKKIPALREESIETGCISLDIQPNPLGAFEVTVDSDAKESSVNPGCTESWTCTSYSSCSSGLQTRSCTDSNNCGTNNNKPTTTQSCESQLFSANLINSKYDETGSSITLNGLTYNYGGSSTYKCTLSDTILNTPEGYAVCSRAGYDITTRVYVQIGNSGLIFKR
jgi:hypothetical protein